MKKLLLLITLICATATPAFAQDEKKEEGPTLTIGSKAPELDIEHWVSDNDGAFKHIKKFEDGKVYIVNFIGDVVVLDAKTGELINNVSMDDPSEDSVRSSVVVAGNQLLIRTNRKLYCVGT